MMQKFTSQSYFNTAGRLGTLASAHFSAASDSLNSGRGADIARTASILSQIEECVALLKSQAENPQAGSDLTVPAFVADGADTRYQHASRVGARELPFTTIRKNQQKVVVRNR
jgi:hypothetical protein